MKATILNGSDKNNRMADRLHNVILDELAELGWDTKSHTLQDMKIVYCVGCFQCWEKTPGVCRFKDDGQIIAEDYIQSDLVILLTPVTFGGHSSTLKKALDRIICLISPMFTRVNGEVHHSRRYKQYPMLLGAGFLSAPDDESVHIFSTLINRNAISFHAPASRSEVFLCEQSPEIYRARIRSLLNNLGGSI